MHIILDKLEIDFVQMVAPPVQFSMVFNIIKALGCWVPSIESRL